MDVNQCTAKNNPHPANPGGDMVYTFVWLFRLWAITCHSGGIDLGWWALSDRMALPPSERGQQPHRLDKRSSDGRISHQRRYKPYAIG